MAIGHDSRKGTPHGRMTIKTRLPLSRLVSFLGRSESRTDVRARQDTGRTRGSWESYRGKATVLIEVRLELKSP